MFYESGISTKFVFEIVVEMTHIGLVLVRSLFVDVFFSFIMPLPPNDTGGFMFFGLSVRAFIRNVYEHNILKTAWRNFCYQISNFAAFRFRYDLVQEARLLQR